jgi:L-alanine-DL-glutamate epimerase-like enolase superfamily enzyme
MVSRFCSTDDFRTFDNCKQIREVAGWGLGVDYHAIDQAEAVRLSSLLEELRPLFAEDLVRSENASVYRVCATGQGANCGVSSLALTSTNSWAAFD